MRALALKLLLAPVIVVSACLLAGVYGALHNQVSYTVSPEYFHAFKFEQFRVPDRFHDRIGAAAVGWAASWWMGLVIGIPVALLGLLVPGWHAYLRHGLIALGLVAATALVVGVGALLLARHGTLAPRFDVPPEVADAAAFRDALAMHEASYLGGVVGVAVAAIYLVVVGVRMRRPAPSRPAQLTRRGGA